VRSDGKRELLAKIVERPGPFGLVFHPKSQDIGVDRVPVVVPESCPKIVISGRQQVAKRHVAGTTRIIVQSGSKQQPIPVELHLVNAMAAAIDEGRDVD